MKVILRSIILLSALFGFGAPSAQADDSAREQQQLVGQPFSFGGVLERGRSTEFSVNGEDIVVNSSTEVVGKLSLGANVSIRGVVTSNQKKVATRINVQERGPAGHSNAVKPGEL